MQSWKGKVQYFGVEMVEAHLKQTILSAELIGGMYKKKIEPFKSICLNTDTAFITAWSNDDSFDNIFVRQLEALGKSGEMF